MTTIERERVRTVAAPAEVTAADVLERAADLLEEFGWCQDDYGSRREGTLCLFGAFQEARRDFGLPMSGWSEDYLRPFRAVGILAPIWWNDRPGRTKAEVVAKLREAAAAAR